MSKRLVNYRTGDRAEEFGKFLMGAFCAIAPIPRQEDFGLADAVATLLRKDGRFWYAEDSFLVQFKSRTRKSVELHGPVYQRWLDQDLSLLVGHVDLTCSTIEVHSLGIALFHEQIPNATGMVAWLHGGCEGLVDGNLHIRLGKPLLRWTIKDAEDQVYTDRAYTVLKAWLSLERWNRRYFRAGVARQICWDTDEVPTIGEEVHTWTPSGGREALADIAPLVRLLGLHARAHPELWGPVWAVQDAMEGSDGSTAKLGLGQITRTLDTYAELQKALENHPTADAALLVHFLELTEDGADFWLHTGGRVGASSSKRHRGTWDQLRDKGFDLQARGETKSIVTLSLDRWLANWRIPHEVIDSPPEIPTVGWGEFSPFYFLKRVDCVPGVEEVPE